MPTSLIQNFVTKYESLKGTAHVVPSLRDAADRAHAICRECESSSVALGDLPAEWLADFERHCAESAVTVLKPPYNSAELPGAIDGAQVGITWADFGIAETATLVEVSVDDAVRLASSLPRVHIGIVRASELLDDLESAAPRLRAVFQEHDRNCVVSFISGPSRTGDIELRLTLGVHGPEAAHTIIVDDTHE